MRAHVGAQPPNQIPRHRQPFGPCGVQNPGQIDDVLQHYRVRHQSRLPTRYQHGTDYPHRWIEPVRAEVFSS
jgi:hypothetical protein